MTSIDLAGPWSVTLDDGSSHPVTLPGTIDLAGLAPEGPSAGMAHLTRRRPFVGRAVYRRSFSVPEAGQMATLVLERTHGRVAVWLDGAPIGRDLTLCAQSRFLLGPLTPGAHSLTLEVDNSDFPAVGEALHDIYPDVAHSTSDHTQTNWNGVIGRMAVELSGAGRIAALQVLPQEGCIRVTAELEGFDANRYWPTFWSGARDRLELTVTLADGRRVTKALDLAIDTSLTEVDTRIDLAHAESWDEFSPVLHRLEVSWLRGAATIATAGTDFGLRDIRREGRHILVNGRRVFFRGTLDCAIFPLTGHPPMDRAAWTAIFARVRDFGLNHIRFHSWCPPRAAFEAADRIGLYLHVETPVWCVLGSDPELDAFVLREAERIVADYGNHPSFVMLTVGNEVAGPGLHGFLERFTRDWRARDPRRIYGGGSGWPTTARADYLSKPEPRSHRWLEGLNSRLNARPLETMTDWSDWVQRVPQPLLGHEIGQWCVYPGLATLPDYTGPLANDAFAQVASDLAAKGRSHLAPLYETASGAHQVALYKEDIEAALRTPDYAGFQLLGLQDFPGQGTALVGVLDAFWREKPYVRGADFARFCGPVVPLLRSESFVHRQGDTFRARVQVSHFGPHDTPGAAAEWRVEPGGPSGRLAHGPLPTGGLHDLGEIAFDTSDLPQGHYRLLVEAAGGVNHWDLWVMAPTNPATLPLCDDMAETMARLQRGQTVVFSPSPEVIRPNAILGHAAMFWNTTWTRDQAPHTLGLINHTGHPLFRAFPAQPHCGWHQWALTFGRRAFDLAGLPLTRIIDVVDDWTKNRDLTLLAEARVGQGRLVLSAIDLTRDDPVTRALAAALGAHLAAPPVGVAEIALQQLTDWAKGALVHEHD